MKEKRLKEKQNQSAQTYWRSVDELEQTSEFKEFLYKEFPAGIPEFSDGVSRRNFLKVMGASFAMAGLASCRRPVEKIVPYVTQPEEIVPGIANYYATSMPHGLTSYGLLVKSNEGRPTKIEGNKIHHSTQGKSNAMLQAQILGLYDPDRAIAPMRKQEGAKGWADFLEYWRALYSELLKNDGKSVAVLSQSFHSPALSAAKKALLKRFPQAKWFTYEPVSDENRLQGIKLVAGRDLQPSYDYHKADVVLSLDADFMATESDSVSASKGFAAARRVRETSDEMNRLYVVESLFSLTGSNADHRLALAAAQIPAFVAALFLELHTQGLNLSTEVIAAVQQHAVHSFNKRWLRVVAKDVLKNRRRSLLVVGRRQSPVVHALAFLINQALGNIDETVSYYPLNDATIPQQSDLQELAGLVNQSKIDTLVVVGGNPVYDAPKHIAFKSLLAKVKHSIVFSPYRDETGKAATWHLPQSHFLESWEDVRSSNGTYSIVQPLVAPLLDSRSTLEFLAMIAEGKAVSGFELVKKSFAALKRAGDTDKAWRKSLHDGLLLGETVRSVQPQPRIASVVAALKDDTLQFRDTHELVLYESAQVFDGRFANNGWLQELPDSITKLTWDNAALLSPALAKQLKVENGSWLMLKANEYELKVPAWIVPGMAKKTIGLALGYGRTHAGRVGDDVGFNAYGFRSPKQTHVVTDLSITKMSGSYALSTTQLHGSMEGRPIVREATVDEYREQPHFAPEAVEHPPLKSLWKEHSYDKGYQWGMAIDLNNCTGCGACTIACQSENNIPVVGKKQVSLGREMHWIRVDRYFSGDADQPKASHQPVTCQHCENAPCEQVCPVAATVHDKEGLNVMAYNRCIGTRYCANNCPYKVRKFNFLNFTNKTTELEKLVHNPDVSVRFRGVMEKCSFCTQRINGAKKTADDKGRSIIDGELETACQQACPADAISFGNLLDPKSGVVTMKKNERNYELLAELNVKPRNSYLAKLRNPNPELEV